MRQYKWYGLKFNTKKIMRNFFLLMLSSCNLFELIILKVSLNEEFLLELVSVCIIVLALHINCLLSIIV